MLSTAYQQRAAGVGGSFVYLSTKAGFVLVLTEIALFRLSPFPPSSKRPVCPAFVWIENDLDEDALYIFVNKEYKGSALA